MWYFALLFVAKENKLPAPCNDFLDIVNQEHIGSRVVDNQIWHMYYTQFDFNWHSNINSAYVTTTFDSRTKYVVYNLDNARQANRIKNRLDRKYDNGLELPFEHWQVGNTAMFITKDQSGIRLHKVCNDKR